MPDLNREPEDTDPTRLTTAALQREVFLIERELSRITENAREATISQVTILGDRIDALKELTNTRVDALTVLLNERFTTSVKALDAAFSAAALAVGTAQLAADKAVDRERDTTNKRFDALDVKFADLSSTVDKNAGADSSTLSNEIAKRFNMVITVSIVSVVIALGAALAAVVR